MGALAVSNFACARLLGIDGSYSLASVGGSGGGASRSRGSGGVGVDAAIVSDGGARSMVDAGAGGSAGNPVDAGLDAPGRERDSGDGGAPECPHGHYEGTFEGVHYPSILLATIPAKLAGIVTLDLGPESDGTVSVRGKLAGFIAANGPPQPDGGAPALALAGVLGAELVGKLDCAARLADGALTTATIATIIPPFQASVEGRFRFLRDRDGTLRGEFSEQETSTSLGTGSGRFEAWRAP